MKRREFFKSIGLGAAVLTMPGVLKAQAAKKPNIIFILSDDVGLDYLSCYGSDKWKTPNLDAMAKSGMRFENCYSEPLCGPTRCQLMTGRYPFRTGGRSNGTAGNPSSKNEIAIPKVLKTAGYVTGQFGKWRQMGETPADWGYDEYLTDDSGGGVYWTKKYYLNGKTMELDKEIFEPDILQKHVLDFINRHSKEPFFLYYPMHLMHGKLARTTDPQADGKDLYADNLALMDKQVGELLAELDRLKLSENTLVFFSGDNGTSRKAAKSVYKLRGREILGEKGTMLEGGARVPLLAAWKGAIQPGSVNNELVDFTDFFVTFAELAGAKLPDKVKLDGHSIVQQLKGQPSKPREWIFVQLGDKWYVRDKGWKLTESNELFNMKNAPFEEIPVPKDSKDQNAAAARKRLQAVLDELKPTGEQPGDKKKKSGKKQKKKKTK